MSGLAVNQGGYALEADRGFFAAGETAAFTFRITGDRGRVVRDEYQLFVPGEFRPNRLAPPRATDQALDTAGKPAGDVDVTLGATGARAGLETPLTFAATFPTAGRYRLFLQFQTGGEVRTVAYTLEVPR